MGDWDDVFDRWVECWEVKMKARLPGIIEEYSLLDDVALRRLAQHSQDWLAAGELRHRADQ